MKSKLLSLRGLAASSVAVVLMTVPASAQKIDCAEVAERVSAAVKANPDQVLTIVEDALVAYEQCACEVVSSAITNSGGSAETVKQIVLVAVQNAETQAPAIAECAVGAAPEHAEAVRIAFAEAFNGKEAPAPVKATGAAATARSERTEVATATSADEAPGEQTAVREWDGKNVVVADSMSGKEPIYGDSGYSGKAPVYAPDAPAAYQSEYFGAAPLTIGNAFLIPPVSASAIIINDDEPEVRIVFRDRKVIRTTTRFVPRTVIRTVPVSPTAP